MQSAEVCGTTRGVCSTTPPTRIARRLEDMGRTHAWLAEKLGVKRQTVGGWFCTAEPAPRARQAQIRLFLGVPTSIELFDDDGFALREEP